MPKQNDEDTILLRLANLAKKHTEFIKDNQNKVYAKIEINGIKHIYPLKSSMYENWLSAIWYATNDNIASTNILGNVIQHLDGWSIFAAKLERVGLRVLSSNDFIEIDLGNDDWTSVQINKEGWKIDKHRGCFYRSKGMQALPIPKRDAPHNVEWLDLIMNLGDTKEKLLLVGWLLGCFMPHGAFPVLILQGEQGSGKSNLASMLRSLVDPTNADKTSFPSSERDFFIQAHNNYLMSFDNQRTLRRHHSDWLCRMATGSGYAARKLYTNHEEESFYMRRPIILNGITQIAGQPDLIDRSVFINLKTISADKRKTEQEIWSLFNAIKPGMFAKICNALVKILGTKAEEHKELPRMADFALFISKAESLFTWKKTNFITAMNESRKEALEQLNEYDMFLSMIVELAEANKKHSFVFLGSPKELFEYLVNKLPNKVSRSEFPDSPASMSKRLNMLKPVLREKGIGVEDRRSNGRRLKKLFWL